MSITIAEVVRRIDPQNTILFFGSGSSIPSGVLSVRELIHYLCNTHLIDENDYTLSEISSLIEEKDSRKSLISSLRYKIGDKTPTGSILNIPLYDWKSIYTTNYDQLIELTYKHHKQDLKVIQSNFDFRVSNKPYSKKLFKIHGSIENDISDGVQSRIIISEADYDNTIDYREYLYTTLEQSLSESNLVIIGHSLSDAHIRDIIDKSIKLNSKAFNNAVIFLLLYEADENRAKLFERRGLKVAFGSLDDFFLELSEQSKNVVSLAIDECSYLDSSEALRIVTTDVLHEIKHGQKDAYSMYQGWPATYSDIDGNLTFERTLTSEIVDNIKSSEHYCITVLGASGTGKSTLSRQVLSKLSNTQFHCWEHKSDHSLPYKDWRKVAGKLQSNNEFGVLFVDEAHEHLNELSNLLDLLIADKNKHLKLLAVSARNHWNPRVKSSNFFKNGKEYILRKLDSQEIDRLILLADTNSDMQPLITSSFQGFSKSERRRRLVAKCESDTFVCLKNIFASEKFDDIILREYAALDEELREIYKIVAVLENSGVKVHRQLIIRLLGINSEDIAISLRRLLEIINEYVINTREGIYGWKGRHPVIMGIISKYKMADEGKVRKLFEDVIDNLVPSYDIEIRTIRQLCAFDTGISIFSDKHVRNVLLRKMISVAPGERIPRHRLIRNLIDVNEFEKADIEINLFEKDFGLDNPVRRYRIILKLARAKNTKGILDEDRLAILEDARNEAYLLAYENPENKDILKTYCDVGLDYYRKTNDPTVYNDAIDFMRSAEETVGDPDITQLIIRSERLFSAIEIPDDEIIA